MEILILCLILAFICIFKKFSKSKYGHLGTPGICLPIVGHSYKLFSKSSNNNPAASMWEIYQKYNNNGILYFKTLSINSVWIGDFDSMRYLFNHPDATRRMNQNMLLLNLPSRKISGKDMTGLVMSSGDIWHQQRRFALRTLKNFGFGKQGRLIFSDLDEIHDYLFKQWRN